MRRQIQTQKLPIADTSPSAVVKLKAESMPVRRVLDCVYLVSRRKGSSCEAHIPNGCGSLVSA